MNKESKQKVLFLREEYGNGQGTYISHDGRKYEGEWKDGREWNGTGYDKNGNIIGKWANGVLQK